MSKNLENTEKAKKKQTMTRPNSLRWNLFLKNGSPMSNQRPNVGRKVAGIEQFCHTMGCPAQEEALVTWGEKSFHAACQAWNTMDDHASPLLLLANLQLIPPTVVATFALHQDLDDSNTLPGTRSCLAVASAWWCLQSKLRAAIDANVTSCLPS